MNKKLLAVIFLLIATLAFAADKYISSSGNIVLKTAASKNVNLQDTLYTTQDGKVGIGISTGMGNLLNLKNSGGGGAWMQVSDSINAASPILFGSYGDGAAAIYQPANRPFYLVTNSAIRLTVLGNGETVIPNGVRSFIGSLVVQDSTTTSLFTLSGTNAVYVVHVYTAAVDTGNYSAGGFIFEQQTSCKFGSSMTQGARLTISLTGCTLQVWQNSGGAPLVEWSVLRIQ